MSVRQCAQALVLILCTIGIGACDGTEAETEPTGGFKMLSPVASATDTPALPSPDIWETPLDDPLLEKGRAVWKGTCIDCHSTGLGGAPLIGNRELWAPRIEKGLDVLVQHALGGYFGKVGEMPARGGNESLSDEEVRAAVHFMTSRAL